MADAYLACAKETSSLSFSDLSPCATSLEFYIFFGLQIVKMFTPFLLQITLVSVYGYREQEMIPLQHMGGQARISFCIPKPFLSHSPPVFPHLLGHVSINISSPTCGSQPIYFLLAVGSLFGSVSGCTRGPVA